MYILNRWKKQTEKQQGSTGHAVRRQQSNVLRMEGKKKAKWKIYLEKQVICHPKKVINYIRKSSAQGGFPA